MAIKINQLDLEITASAKEATSAINGLIKSLEKLQSVMKKINMDSVSRKAGKASGITDIDKKASSKAYADSVVRGFNAGNYVNAKFGLGEYQRAAKSAADSFAVFEKAGMVSSKRVGAVFSSSLKQIGKNFIGLFAQTTKATSGFSKLFSAMKRIAFYRAIRTFIKAITSGISDGIKNLVRYEQAFRKIENANYVMSELGSNWLWIKNSMGAVAVTILNALLPAIQKLASALVTVINLANHFISAFAGKDQYAKATKSAYNYATAIGAIKKQLFGFDELNILNSNSENGGASLGSMFEPAEVNENLKAFAVAVSDGFGNIIQSIEQNLDTIAMIIGGAYAAIGLILLLSGHIPVGVGLLIAGLSAFAIGYGFNTGLIDSIKGEITNLMTWVGTMLLPIGLMIAMTGNIPLGIGLMIAGAAGIATATAIDKGALTGNIQGMITEIMAILGGAAMAIGACLLLSPVSFGLGLGLLFGGAVALGSAIAFNPKYFSSRFIVMWGELSKQATLFKVAVYQWFAKLNEDVAKWVDALVGKINIFKSALTLLGFGNLVSLGSALSMFQNPVRKAEGGTVNTGQLFIAQEAGPELVGTVGGKTTVTNQDQFIAGLASANETVVQATLAIGNAIVNAINSKDTTIQLDGATVSRQIYKSMQTESTRRGTSLIQGA